MEETAYEGVSWVLLAQGRVQWLDFVWQNFGLQICICSPSMIIFHVTQSCITPDSLELSQLVKERFIIRGVAIKLPEWFYWKDTRILKSWEGSPSKYSPWVAVHLAQRCSHCWKHFYNCFCGIALSAIVTYIWIPQCAEIFVPLRQTLFLETATSLSEPNQGNRVGVPFQ